MPTSELLDEPPWSQFVTVYDEVHFELYAQLLDADAAGIDCDEIVERFLKIDMANSARCGRDILNSHLKRARWMTEVGYKQLL